MFPYLDGVRLEHVVPEDDLLRIVAGTVASALAPRPDCKVPSKRRHSGYERHLADGAGGGRRVRNDLMIRRLFCDNPDCARVTFAEQVEGLTVRYGRRMPLLGCLLEAISVVLAGRPGARLAELLPAPVSRTTMLRLLMSLPDPVAGTPRVLGIDDFALKRGHIYGSILVNCETSAPVGVLEDREADTAAA